MTPILGITASSITSSFLGGDFESIATVSVGSGGSTNIDFNSIPTTYKHLQIRLIARSTRNVAGSVQTNVGIRVGNGSVDTGSNYAYHSLYGDGSSAAAFAAASTTSGLGGWITAFNATANRFGVSVIDILDYADTNKNTTIRVLTGEDQNGSGQVRFISSLWNNTAAINTIRLFDFNGSGDFVQYSHFALYGIQG